MRLSDFIQKNMNAIVDEWQTFAMTLLPAAAPMTAVALRDHAEEILKAIVDDLTSYQSAQDQADKSRGLDPAGRGGQWAASIHGKLRHEAGFNLTQLAAEYRALRASVLRLWRLSGPDKPEDILEDLTRFNEAIDEALADSIWRYSMELDRSRNTFIGMLGHDLRTPLNAISMSAQYLAMENMLDGERLPAAARITRSVKTMNSMIRDLLEFAQENLGNGIPIEADDANIGMLCKTALEDMQVINTASDLRLEMSGELNGRFDAPRIQQVLSNLLGNAVKYSTRHMPIMVTARGEPDNIIVSVSNRGQPIPGDSLEAIFDPLVQLKSAPGNSTEPSTSIGLGLYIARQIMLAHGGSLSVSSSDEGGTTFTAKLPR